MQFIDERPVGLFAAYDIGTAYDEMFTASMRPRPHYRQLFEQLAASSQPDFARR
jgi:uncharacterized circularly permuted ATP-grasp superfamily protein